MYDLLILSFNQEKSSYIKSDKVNIKALNASGADKKKYYYEIWPFINNAYGILYKLYTREGLGEFECCDEMFEFQETNNLELTLQQIVPSISNECADDWVQMKLNTEYSLDVIVLLDKLLASSPISTIAFLCSGQSLDEELVLGTLSRDCFVEMLQSGNIKTNICYLIKNSSKE